MPRNIVCKLVFHGNTVKEKSIKLFLLLFPVNLPSSVCLRDVAIKIRHVMTTFTVHVDVVTFRLWFSSSDRTVMEVRAVVCAPLRVRRSTQSVIQIERFLRSEHLQKESIKIPLLFCFSISLSRNSDSLYFFLSLFFIVFTFKLPPHFYEASK